ncbi:MAG: potassium channel family protein [Panacagrimonas sp.]
MLSELRHRLQTLAHGGGTAATRWRWAKLGFDLALIAFFLFSTFVEHGPGLIMADYVIGAVLGLECLLSVWLAKDRIAAITRPLMIVDLIVIASLFAPSLTENLVFLRVLRALRLLRSYHMIASLRRNYRLFANHEQLIVSATNLLVFIFVVAAAVYALQVRTNEQIENYVDALYFTITTLTTTGFGDIVMVGSAGRFTAIIIMIVGASLFLRLMQAIFRPNKIDHECPDCGLARHDPDAVHCKHCGQLIHIRTLGADQ